MSGSGSPAKAGNGGHTPSWEMAGLDLSVKSIPKKADIIKMEGGIGTIYGGNGGPADGGRSKGFVRPGSLDHPSSMGHRFSGNYEPHKPQPMRLTSDAQPKKPQKTIAPSDPMKIQGDGVTRGGNGKLEANYKVKDPDTKTLTLQGEKGAKFPFKVSGRQTDTYTQPVKVGNKTYYMTPKDSTDLQFAQGLFGTKGTPRMSVA